MQNCYRKGRTLQPDSEEVEGQNGRLTTKHIHTLKFLQDVVNENKALKARVDELEVSRNDEMLGTYVESRSTSNLPLLNQAL